MKEAFPTATHIEFIWNPGNPSNSIALKETENAAHSLGFQVEPLTTAAFHGLKQEPGVKREQYALVTTADPAINSREHEIIQFAKETRLPAIYAVPEFAEHGGLMSYAPNYNDQHRRAASYVDKILKGSKPSELPVEQPTKFELLINLKAAQQIGVTIPPTVLSIADKVIKERILRSNAVRPAVNLTVSKSGDSAPHSAPF